ncbi:hypothetical protein Y1Q_0006464 [Alligator mississippiensis]|uniref:Uncharacterized protein n=1 Tax=Alligator mississippiensis TaxID=8496 RepID=A0A151MVM5_ALLMI|nr:hypothetical protein Y1Q_0006464 [Alligator mississippiensis]
MVTAAEGYHHSCVIQVRARAAIGAVWIQPKVQEKTYGDFTPDSDGKDVTVECFKSELKRWLQQQSLELFLCFILLLVMRAAITLDVNCGLAF